jgi:hypothetical protein
MENINQYSQWSSEEQKTFKDWLAGLLHTNVVTVEFTKINGDSRTMQATLKEDILPKAESAKSSTRKANTEVCTVWDVDKSSWRSFRYDKLIGIRFTI